MQEGGKRRRKKGSKKVSKKKGSKKVSKKKSKRQAPAHMKIQVEVIKAIAAKEGIKYNEAMRKLKEYVKKAIGGDHKEKGVAWIDALKKVKSSM